MSKREELSKDRLSFNYFLFVFDQANDLKRFTNTWRDIKAPNESPVSILIYSFLIFDNSSSFSSFSFIFFTFLFFLHFLHFSLFFSTLQNCGEKWKNAEKWLQNQDFFPCAICVCTRRLRWHVDRNLCFVVIFFHFFFFFSF